MNRGRLFRRLTALAVCAVLVGLAAGCGGGGASKPAASTIPASGTGTAAATGTGTTTSPASAVVAPPGAAYSYRVPDGLKLASASGSGSHLSLVIPASLPAASGTISISQATSNANASAQATDRFLGALDRQEVAFYRSHGAAIAPGTRTTIAGHPAICWKLSHFDNSFGGTDQGIVDGEACTIVAGSVIVQQGCNWKPSARAIVERGCVAVRASLKVS